MTIQDLLLEVTLKLGRIDSRLAHMEHMMEQTANEYTKQRDAEDARDTEA